MTGVRLDKWLWAARFFKTRGLAGDEIDKGRVSVNGQAAKASREVKVGDQIELRQNHLPRTVRVNATSNVRGPAPTAQALCGWSPRPASTRAGRPNATGVSSPNGSAGAPRPSPSERRAAKAAIPS